MKKNLRLLAFLVVLVIALSISVSAFATGTANSKAQPYKYDAETGTFTFTDLASMGYSTMPYGLFQGAEAMTKIVIIDDAAVKAIGDNAFLNCFRLEKIVIPATVTKIADSAFWGCPSNIEISGAKGSAAQEFAKKHNYTFKEIGKKRGTESSISEGVAVTILGMGVVFIVLILLWGVLSLFEVMSGSKKIPVKVPEKAAPQPTTVSVVDDVDDTELIAVITAAIAASQGTSSSRFNIRSVKRLSSAWSQSAKVANLNNNF